jgi:nucleotide-binding universal stress UspA family protein
MKILFPTDFSESAQNAYQHALFFADRTGADLTVLHVVYPVADAIDIPAVAGEVIQEQVDAAKEVMQQFLDHGSSKVLIKLKKTPQVSSNIKVGVPVSVIRKTVSDQEIDLVIMGTKGSHNAVEKMLGTVSSGVIAKASCPVLVIPEHAEAKELHSIVYATDIEEADPYEIWKSTQLLAPVSAIFRIVHVQTEKEEPDETEGFDELKAFFKNNPVSIQVKFHQLKEKNIEDALSKFTQDYGADLLVMYRPHRSFIEDIFHRSHTKRMLGKSAVPLLIMKD